MIPRIPVRAWIIGILTALTVCGLIYMATVGGYAWIEGQYATATLYARLLPVVVTAWAATALIALICEHQDTNFMRAATEIDMLTYHLQKASEQAASQVTRRPA
ncbi:MAG: hypothetical protein PUK59_04690 [Actinomycetaceae bacterium]|nr:hypothetical protein [Actinomycetaceae bacterium]MDY5273628.1 hypothetical protein [Arcanobacterium sp.]